MTKTETKRLVAELRREAALISNVLTPTPQWILDQTGGRNLTDDEIRGRIEEALNNVDGISAQLREAWVED
jgi:hypothetical protein